MKKKIVPITLCIVAVFIWLQLASLSQKKVENFFYAQISKPLEGITLVDIEKNETDKPEINADSVFSVKIDGRGRERVFIRKNTQQPLAIASLSKLMTALIVLENTDNDYNLSRVITISEEGAGKENVPVYGNLQTGQSFTVRKLLQLMLVYSSNDAAFSLAEVIGKQSFVEKMNRRAKELGLENTYFVNPTGLDPESNDLVANYSTGQDLLVLSRYILENQPLILEIASAGGPYPTSNGFSDLQWPSNMAFAGGKTGYTEKAGGCLLFFMKNEKGNYIINIILGTASSKERVQEAQKLINWLSI